MEINGQLVERGSLLLPCDQAWDHLHPLSHPASPQIEVVCLKKNCLLCFGYLSYYYCLILKLFNCSDGIERYL